ncbi:MAG: DUF169 domain-containing protein [Peptococcaceae bacterium]|jgi:uncharacterized protein (DUF169 family)|nr:DUF169 domain-containing protein [Peptococcaceae bacterium]
MQKEFNQALTPDDASPTFAAAQELFEHHLKLDYHPVAIKFFASLEEMKRYPAEKEPTAKLTFCQFTAASRMANLLLHGTPDQIMCDNCLTTFGCREPSEQEAEGHFKYVVDHDFARDVLDTKPRAPLGLIKGFLTAPLAKTPLDPDVVLFICNPFQAYHILNDYVGACHAHPLQFYHTVNSAVCGGAVWTYLNQKPEMNTMCAGSYTSGKTEKGEVNVFIPGSRILDVARQLARRSNISGGASLLYGNNEWPGLDVCKKCPMVRFSDPK